MKKTIIAVGLAALGTAAFAQPGYVTRADGTNVMSGYGLCVHSGYWSQDLAAVPCDGAQRPVAAAPAPAPAPTPIATPAPQPAPIARAAPQPMYEKVALSADLLFEFNSATLKEEGKRQLDQLSERIQGANLDQVMVTGHADRIGSAKYNQKLSEERARVAMEYLRNRSSAGSQNWQTAGKGESQPVTGSSCSNLGRESGVNRKLVQCLSPDRRVEIQLTGQRLATPTGTAPDAARGGSTPASLSR